MMPSIFTDRAFEAPLFRINDSSLLKERPDVLARDVKERFEAAPGR